MEPIMDASWCREHGACYTNDRLAALFDRPMTVLEVLTRTDGAWADVSARDRFWVFSRPGAATPRVQRLVACFAAELRHPSNPRAIEAIRVARRFANGQATATELAVAQAALLAGIDNGESWADAAAAWVAAWRSAAAARGAAWAARGADADEFYRSCVDEAVRLIRGDSASDAVC